MTGAVTLVLRYIGETGGAFGPSKLPSQLQLASLTAMYILRARRTGFLLNEGHEAVIGNFD